jgi:hypothetical protein
MVEIEWESDEKGVDNHGMGLGKKCITFPFVG